jgi:hypothetical protein
MDENRVTILDDGEPDRRSRNRGNAWLLLTGAGLLSVAVLAIFGVFGDVTPAPDAQALPDSTTTSSTTTTTLGPAELAALEYEADVELISQLWSDQTAAWSEGFESGIAFWVQNNYPDMGCSHDDYLQAWFPNGPVEGLRFEREANANTIRADDGWVIPGGNLQGVTARGRVYVMEVSDKFVEPGADSQPTRIQNFHATVIEGRAHFFIGCPT